MDPRRFVPLSAQLLAILLVLASKPQHGYSIARHIAEHSFGFMVIEPGNVYRRLRVLFRRGLVERAPRTGLSDKHDPRRKHYDSDSNRGDLPASNWGQGSRIDETY